MVTKRLRNQQGFTLVELSVVIVIIGVLAAFGVPKFKNAVERSKAAEAFNYLSALRESQERYQARQGTYAADPTNLDISIPTLKYFILGTVQAGATNSLEDSWTLTLTRSGSSGGYGPYTVTFTQDGYDSANSTINAQDAINPMSTT
jgi:prepilin-type N-terminal cleavage/methylation domain-containing protein